jgi:hypothetical protein
MVLKISPECTHLNQLATTAYRFILDNGPEFPSDGRYLTPGEEMGDDDS